jgi:hypothetical protein
MDKNLKQLLQQYEIVKNTTLKNDKIKTRLLYVNVFSQVISSVALIILLYHLLMK